MKRIFLLLTALLALSSCAVTHLSSIVSPTHSSYAHILVFANYKDIDLRKSYEYTLYYALKDKGVTPYCSVQLFPPLDEYTDSDYDEVMQRYHIDAVLSITPNGASTVTRSSYNSFTGQTTTYDDISNVATVASLLDRRTGKTVYRANLSTDLAELTQMSTARSSMASKLADDLEGQYFLSVLK